MISLFDSNVKTKTVKKNGQQWHTKKTIKSWTIKRKNVYTIHKYAIQWRMEEENEEFFLRKHDKKSSVTTVCRFCWLRLISFYSLLSLLLLLESLSVCQTKSANTHTRVRLTFTQYKYNVSWKASRQSNMKKHIPYRTIHMKTFEHNLKTKLNEIQSTCSY